MFFLLLEIRSNARTSFPLQAALMIACLCDIVALASILHSGFIQCPWSHFWGIFGEKENWPLCNVGRSVHRKGSFRLMTRGGDSLQAFMHHVPFTAKHVRERSHWEFRGYLRSISITFCLLPVGSEHRCSAAERLGETETGQGVGVWCVEVLKPN